MLRYLLGFGGRDKGKHINRICEKRINQNKAHVAVEYKCQDYLLCCTVWKSGLEKDPEKHPR